MWTYVPDDRGKNEDGVKEMESWGSAHLAEETDGETFEEIVFWAAKVE